MWIDPGAVTLPRRVLMTADTVGGVWTYALELIGALATYGVEVILATMGRRLSDAQRRDLHSLPNVCHYESAFRLEWMESPWGDVTRAGDWLLKLAAIHKPDVIHLNNYGQAALPFDAPVLLAAHSCVNSWWRAVHRADPPPEWAAYTDLVRAGVQRAAGIIAPTHAMLDAVRACYGNRPGMRVIPNGRSAYSFQPAAAKLPLIFSMGRVWDAAKNTALLDAVSGEIAYPIYIAGEGVPSSGGKGNAAPSAHYLGPLSSECAAEWLANAEIYALPALYEPFGLSVLEAALSGCALILGDIPSLRENWDGAALFVDPRDARALRTALQRVIADPALRAELRTKARARAMLFSPGRMGTATLDVYRTLMQRGAPCGS
ncbi:MAG: glycosyltransferase family 4 protein [bacterium]|nr:glycosyltransferase family 4 protein [bacterium]